MFFSAVKLTKNADIDKYKYFGYGIRFDEEGTFSFCSGGFGCNVTIFGVDPSSSSADNNKKHISILGEGLMQGLDGTTLTAQKMYSINFTKSRDKFCLSLHCNRANIYSFVSGKDIIKFKAKDFEIVATPLCLGNISKYFSVNNIKKTGLYRHSQVFNEKEQHSIKCLGLLKKCLL